MKRKGFLSIVLVILLAAGVSAGLSLKASAQEDTVLFGLDVPLTGAYSDQGAGELKAYKLAIDEINSQGGLLGKRIIYSVKDTETNASVAAKNAADLYDNYNAVMVTGGSSSAVAIAQGVEAKKRGKIFMVALSHSNATTGFGIDPKTMERTVQKANRYVFRWYHNAWMSAHAAAKYLLDKFGTTAKYYYLTADYTWGWTTEKSFRDVTEAAGCTTLAAVRTPLGEKSYVKYLLAAKAANPDVLVLSLFGKDMINCLKQATAMGLKSKIKIVVPLIELHMAKGAGAEAMQGVLGTNPWYWRLEDKYPGSRDFVNKFKARYGAPPGDAAASAWVAIFQYADAVKRANSFDAPAVIKALEGHHFTLLKGDEYWRAWDHQAISSTLVLEGKGPNEITDAWDVLKVLAEIPGEKVARTKKQNPVKWETRF